MARKNSSENNTTVNNPMISIVAQFYLGEQLTFSAYKEDENVGTLMIKDGFVSYYDFATGKVTDYKDDVVAFNEFAKQFIFRKSTDNKWVEYNPNPQGKNTGDCSIRAYCKAENLTWNKAYDIAIEWGRKLAAIPDDHVVCHKILTKHFGYEFKRPEKGKRITVNQFAIDNPIGTYVLHVRAHLVTVVNGQFYDTWDSGSRKVSGIYIKKTV